MVEAKLVLSWSERSEVLAEGTVDMLLEKLMQGLDFESVSARAIGDACSSQRVCFDGIGRDLSEGRFFVILPGKYGFMKAFVFEESVGIPSISTSV